MAAAAIAAAHIASPSAWCWWPEKTRAAARTGRTGTALAAGVAGSRMAALAAPLVALSTRHIAVRRTARPTPIQANRHMSVQRGGRKRVAQSAKRSNFLHRAVGMLGSRGGRGRHHARRRACYCSATGALATASVQGAGQRSCLLRVGRGLLLIKLRKGLLLVLRWLHLHDARRQPSSHVGHCAP